MKRNQKSSVVSYHSFFKNSIIFHIIQSHIPYCNIFLFFQFLKFVSDLRWNNIGLLGGRSILSALDYNKTLVKLLLAGNNIPSDVVKAIGK